MTSVEFVHSIAKKYFVREVIKHSDRPFYVQDHCVMIRLNEPTTLGVFEFGVLTFKEDEMLLILQNISSGFSEIYPKLDLLKITEQDIALSFWNTFGDRCKQNIVKKKKKA
jgi:hypothetical protein